MSSRGLITYELAKLLAKILSPHVGNIGHALKNSAEIVSELSNLTLGSIDVLKYFAVTALFMKVQVEEVALQSFPFEIIL